MKNKSASAGSVTRSELLCESRSYIRRSSCAGRRGFVWGTAGGGKSAQSVRAGSESRFNTESRAAGDGSCAQGPFCSCRASFGRSCLYGAARPVPERPSGKRTLLSKRKSTGWPRRAMADACPSAKGHGLAKGSRKVGEPASSTLPPSWSAHTAHDWPGHPPPSASALHSPTVPSITPLSDHGTLSSLQYSSPLSSFCTVHEGGGYP